jgi:hypothetical protein
VNQYLLWYLGLLERGLLEVIFHQEKVEFELEATDFVFDGDQPFSICEILPKNEI